MQSLEVFEVFFYFLHLCLDVAVGYDGLGADDAAPGEVEPIEQDGDFGYPFFQSGWALRVPSGVMQRRNLWAWRALWAMMSVECICLVR